MMIISFLGFIVFCVFLALVLYVIIYPGAY